jgi:hypothetical protein
VSQLPPVDCKVYYCPNFSRAYGTAASWAGWFVSGIVHLLLLALLLAAVLALLAFAASRLLGTRSPLRSLRARWERLLVYRGKS